MKSDVVGQLKYVSLFEKWTGMIIEFRLENVSIRMERFCNMNRGCIFVG